MLRTVENTTAFIGSMHYFLNGVYSTNLSNFGYSKWRVIVNVNTEMQPRGGTNFAS